MKFENRYNFLLILSIIVVILSGCYNPSKHSYFNISSSYQEQSKSFNFKFCAYNSSSNQVNIYYKFNTAGLLFIKHKTKDFFFAKYQIHYELYDLSEPKTLLDSATMKYTDSTDFNHPKEITDSFQVFTNKNSNYIVAYQFTDLNKNYEVNGFLNIDKTNEYSRNNFLLKDEDNIPLIENYVNSEQKFRVDVNQKLKDKLYVSYYNLEFPLAGPPYSMIPADNNSFVRDSMFVLSLQDGSRGDILLNEPGMYFFQTDTNQKEGLSVFRFYDNFPKVTTAVHMLKPLQYITTKQEFSDIANSKNLRQSIEKFWLDKSGNPNRAKEMIRLFYNRVQDANNLFTSYKEGWKTDRGMMYIILGPPERVYRSAENETWFYSEDRNMLSITLVFTKIPGKFSDDDYMLERGIEYKDPWYIGVESWRK